ncbi:MAG: hypothetical protein KAK00_01485 [Nanoarchaeota archaeon]|nr:hypothetical protein [Nanoarchaeota archaeon]
MQKVACAVLVAYTLLVLCKKTLGILMRIQTMFKRGLRTIGELCRFMRLSCTERLEMDNQDCQGT